jgi:tetrapyrrole methylase family protein/MazG family protein
MSQGITVVGLGPGAPGLLTVEAQQFLASADEIYVRTQKHPTVATLPPQATIHSFDPIYERAETFGQVYAEIAARIVELGQRQQGVVYAVPGHPLVGEASVQRILALAEAKGLAVHIIEGLSFIEPVCTRLRQDPLNGWQIADATELTLQHYPAVNPDLPLLIGQLYGREVAADVKLALMTIYPDDHRVILVRAAGTTDESLSTIPLYELDRSGGIDHLTSLYVPSLTVQGSLATFQEIVALLRAPEGCPWDREQTHRSLRPFLLEETHEVLEALDKDDTVALKEELGDLLLQILLHTQIALEDEEFRMTDVVGHIVAKLKRRHPHVFGQVHVSGAQEVLVNWERIKGQEKAALNQQQGNHDDGTGVLSGVPITLPALARAQALRFRASRVGFDWPGIEGAWAKVEEEWQELRTASDPCEQESELGDVLFALAILASWLDLDAEGALRAANARFEQRFRAMEREVTSRGMVLAALKPAQLIALWDQVRKQNS